MPIREKIEVVEEKGGRRKKFFLRNSFKRESLFFIFFCGVSEWKLWENAQKGLRKESESNEIEIISREESEICIIRGKL